PGSAAPAAAPHGHEIRGSRYETDGFACSRSRTVWVRPTRPPAASIARKSWCVGPLARANRDSAELRGTPVAIPRPVTRRVAATTQCGTAAHSHRTRAVLTHSVGEDPMNLVKSFVRNDEGQDLLEYALLVALIALVAI